MSSDVLLPVSRHRGSSDASRLRIRLAALVGFLFGFAMAFVTLLTYGNSVSEVLSERPTTIVVTTGEGSALGSAVGSAVGSSSGAIAKSEPDLYQEIRIVCMVLTHSGNHHKAVHLNATWGKRCNRLLFISNEDDLDLGAVNIGVEDSHENLWEKTREGFRYVYENLFSEGDWFLKADDDTYMVMENLRYLLYGYDTEMPVYFGHKFAYEEYIYMSGGSGYVLSKEALRRFMEVAFHNESLCYGPYPNSEDLQMGSCLGNVGVEAGSSVDLSDSTQRFYPLRLSDYIQPDAESYIPPWLYNRSVEPIQTGPSCCSDYAIAFHYMEPVDMYVYDFLIYRMQVHGLRKDFRALPEKGSLQVV